MKITLPKPKTLKWTQHIRQKMREYGLSEARIKRVMNHPTRLEEGIAPQTIAAMQPVMKRKKTTQEIWMMYQDRKTIRTMITAWRYPGKSPIRGEIPIPASIRRALNLS